MRLLFIYDESQKQFNIIYVNIFDRYIYIYIYKQKAKIAYMYIYAIFTFCFLLFLLNYVLG